MSTRQNKKRKSRANVINRERTVTTLTEGSEGSFMAADETHASLMSHPFSVASAVQDTTNISPGFPIASTPGFSPFPYPYMQSMTGGNPAAMFNQTQPTTHYFPTAQPLPPGQNDLEILERLKETIKAGQHEFFRPVPRPEFLASVYLGPHPVPQVPPHAEQDPRTIVSNNDKEGRRVSPNRQGSTGDGIPGLRKLDTSSSVRNNPGALIFAAAYSIGRTIHYRRH